MKIPAQIKVGGNLYKVVPREGVFQDANRDLVGMHSVYKHEIHIDISRSSQASAETLIHEGLHALWDHLGLPEDMEEYYINKLTSGMFMLMKDNPLLVKYIMSSKRNR